MNSEDQKLRELAEQDYLEDPEVDFEAINTHSPNLATEAIRTAKDKKRAAAMADALGLKYDPAVLDE